MKKSPLMLLLLVVSALLLSISFIYAYPSGHIGLLTVSEGLNNTELGGVADLYLVVQPGTGRIFIDSFPLSKIDTQITMRFASEVACDLLDKDCSGYDFFYTISANSAIVGGPSAGAAATVLTVAVLDSQKLDPNTVMTGTINSGNLIGPVAGVPAKARAAQLKGYTRVLIPRWDIVNNTPDKNLTIKVMSISTLEDALYYFTGKNYTVSSDTDGKINSDAYTSMMRQVTTDLCTKYGKLNGDAIILPNLTNYGVNVTNSSQDNFQLAQSAINNNSYYSAASFCFGGNVRITNVLVSNYTNEDLKLLYAKLLGNVSEFERKLDNSSGSLSTISELETYMIVAERISETKGVLSDINPENISAYQLSYALERFNTAVVWLRFSKLPGQSFAMDPELLRVVCSKKLSEAEERLNYLELYYPDSSLRDDLTKAYDYYSRQDYALCIFTASKVKADSDIVLSAIFVPEADMARLFDEKIAAARRIIIKQKNANIFPILGYSYYEYANTLKDTDTYSALLYAEYSLELSNLDMYFKKRDALSLSTASPNLNISAGHFYLFALGLSCGILLSTIVIFVLYQMSFKKNIKPGHELGRAKQVKNDVAHKNRKR
jgi:uncharacterized protein